MVMDKIHNNKNVENVEKINTTTAKIRKCIREHNEVTGIHGLRYLTEKRSGGEKIFWTVILLLSLGGCIYMIYEILYKYENSPVVVSFATEETPIYNIPFPAVTICPEAKYSGRKFNYSKISIEIADNNMENINETVLNNFFYLSLLCKDMVLQEDNETINSSFYSTIDELKPNSDLFMMCSFMGNFYACKDILKPIIIDEGVCYAFNIFDRADIFQDHVFNYKNYFHVNDTVNSFNLESGYSKKSGTHAYPRRALTSGAVNNLEIWMGFDVADKDCLCTSFYQGWRVLIHSPYDVPRLSQNYFRIPFDKVVVAAIEPQLVITSEDVRSFPSEKRKCFMLNERPLQHFKLYTQSNCKLECITNYTLAKCGCVSFYMPHNNTTAICSKSRSECVQDAERDAKIEILEENFAPYKSSMLCDCKPSCTQLRFMAETSHSDFYFREYLESHPTLGELYKKNKIHHSILSIYFKNEHFMPIERSQLYGISDLISNLGGLLGLFTGFSLITLAEIIYFLSLRIFCNKKLYGEWSGS